MLQYDGKRRTLRHAFSMTSAPARQRNLAERLIAHESSGDNASEPKPLGAFQAIDKLRPHLVTLQGNIGFRSLVSRSIAVAGEETRWLRAVHVKSDGSLSGLEELQAQVGPEQFYEGGVALLAQLLTLLFGLIGEDLTLQLAHEAWPDLPLNKLAAGRRK
jgi:hypothetical protein